MLNNVITENQFTYETSTCKCTWMLHFLTQVSVTSSATDFRSVSLQEITTLASLHERLWHESERQVQQDAHTKMSLTTDPELYTTHTSHTDACTCRLVSVGKVRRVLWLRAGVGRGDRRLVVEQRILHFHFSSLQGGKVQYSREVNLWNMVQSCNIATLTGASPGHSYTV